MEGGRRSGWGEPHRNVMRAFLPLPPQGFLNLEQLSKGLMDLLLLYQTAQQLGVPTPNSAEFKYVWEV